MKILTRIISGIAASFLLAIGLHAAAGKLDPISHDAGNQDPGNATTDKGKISTPPCISCLPGD